MPEDPAPRVPVLDLRGLGGPPPGAVLADPSGRRARLLGRGGRVVGLVFVAWFCCLVLAGLGLLPAGGIPLGGSVGPSQPRRLARIPAPRQPSLADLRPASPVRSATAASTRAGRLRPSSAGSTRAPAGGSRSGRLGSKKAKALPAAPVVASGPASGAPAARVPIVSQGGAATAPGHSTATTTGPGHSGAAPGTTTHAHTTTTTATATTPGKSGSAPGQTRTSTTGHGPPG